MSVMPAAWTESSEHPSLRALPAQAPARSEIQVRVGRKEARRSRQRWAIASGSGLFAFFAFTVAMLELLH